VVRYQPGANRILGGSRGRAGVAIEVRLAPFDSCQKAILVERNGDFWSWRPIFMDQRKPEASILSLAGDPIMEIPLERNL
jgi:hypothetical protein